MRAAQGAKSNAASRDAAAGILSWMIEVPPLD